MNRQLLLAKKEVTYGTPVALAAADTIYCENVKLTPRGERVKGDPAQPGFGPVPGFVYGEHYELTFDVPLAASGTAGTAPKWGGLMKACGWAETVVATTSVTYALMANPLTADSMTMKWREGLREHQLSGARGRVSLKADAGGRPMLSFVFRGLYSAPIAGAALAQADATWTGWKDARPIAQGRTTFSLGGQALTLRSLGLDAADNITFTDVPHQENIELSGARSFSGKVKVGVPALGTFNPESQWTAGTIVVAALVHEVGSAGNIVTVNARGQLLEPGYSRDDNTDVFEAGYELNSSALNTDDDFAIVLT